MDGDVKGTCGHQWIEQNLVQVEASERAQRVSFRYYRGPVLAEGGIGEITYGET